MAKFLAYDININIPMLIEEVRARPAIYDTKSVEYLDRNKKIQLWREICEKLNKNYKDYSNIDKIAFGKEVQKKWSSLRDSFRRDLAILSFQQKLPPHSGGAKKKCKYKYFDSLLYLLPYVHVNKTNGLSVVTPSDIPSEQSQDTEPQAELMESTSDWYYNEMQPSPESVTIKRPRTDSDVSAAMNIGDRQTNTSIFHDISDRTLYEDDDDKLFLLSLVPSFRDYSMDEKYLLRIELMQTIMRFKQSRRENEGTLAGSIKTEVDSQSHTVN